VTRPRRWSVFVLLALAGWLLAASDSLGQDIPYLTGRVNDRADMLTAGERERAEALLRGFEEETGTQIVLLTVPTLQGTAIEEYALSVAEAWALGRAEVDDGVLFLVVRDDRKLRIETGYGLEGALTDAESRRILDWVVVPRFREGRFAEGILDGITAITEETRGETGVPLGPSAAVLEQARQARQADVWVAVAMLAVFALVILWLARRNRRRFGSGDAGRRWSSRSGRSRRPRIVVVPGPRRGGRSRETRARGRSGGGFGGGGGFRGGGGGFGGGGASSGW